MSATKVRQAVASTAEVAKSLVDAAVFHHANSRRFRCACGKLHDRWPINFSKGSPVHTIVCTCNRRHYRGENP